MYCTLVRERRSGMLHTATLLCALHAVAHYRVMHGWLHDHIASVAAPLALLGKRIHGRGGLVPRGTREAIGIAVVLLGYAANVLVVRWYSGAHARLREPPGELLALLCVHALAGADALMAVAFDPAVLGDPMHAMLARATVLGTCATFAHVAAVLRR